jgi:hypothetical protein
MAPGEVKIDGYRNGMPVVRHGGDVDPATLKIHQDMAWQTGRDWNPMSRLGGALNPFNTGNPLNPLINRALGLPTATGPAAPRFGSQGYEFKMEDIKHRQMTESALTRAQELRQQGDVAGANRLELQAQQYRLQADQYAAIANDPTQRNLRGDNYIAANRELTQDLTVYNNIVRDGGLQVLGDPRVQLQSNQLLGNTGRRDDPFMIGDGPGILGWANLVSNGQVPTSIGQGNYLFTGSTRVYERQQRGVNNAFLNFHPSSYDAISNQILTPMMQRTRMSDGDVAGALQRYMQGGKNSLPEELHSEIPHLDRLRLLMFGRESIRNPSNVIQAPMTLDLIRNPRDPMTWNEAFAAYQGSGRRGERGAYPMSMLGGNGAAVALNRAHQERLTGEIDPNAKPLSSKAALNGQELISRESELTQRWLQAHGITDLNDPKAAQDRIANSAIDFYYGSVDD